MKASERMILNRPGLECAWREGICLCPTCGAVLRVVPRAQFTPHVVDADGRAHYCERYIAASFQRHGVEGMQPILDKHAARPVVDPPPHRDPPSQRGNIEL